VLVLVAVVAGVALLAAQLYAPVPVKPPRLLTGDATVPIRTAHILNGRTAAVETESGLLLTKDGGQHWQLGLKLDWQSIDYFSFVGPDRIVVLSGSRTGKQLINTTTDGGAHWETHPIGLVSDYAYRTMFFLDTREGWAVESARASKEPGPITVHHTRDGGIHWTRLWHTDSAAGANGLVFTDSLHGFMGSYNYDGIARLYVTADGGANWQIAEVPRPPGVWNSGCCNKAIIEPTLTLSGSRGILLIHMPRTAVYTTSDTGRSWTFSQFLPAEMYQVQLVDHANWLGFDGRALYRTADAGLTWKQIPVKLPENGSLALEGLSLTDSKELWGYSRASIPEIPDSACYPGFGPTCSFLIRSTDGGATWSIVKMPAAGSMNS
jgi:photosystem II stability/assembly factor-like uncharacterized protein